MTKKTLTEAIMAHFEECTSRASNAVFELTLFNGEQVSIKAEYFGLDYLLGTEVHTCAEGRLHDSNSHKAGHFVRLDAIVSATFFIAKNGEIVEDWM